MKRMARFGANQQFTRAEALRNVLDDLPIGRPPQSVGTRVREQLAQFGHSAPIFLITAQPVESEVGPSPKGIGMPIPSDNSPTPVSVLDLHGRGGTRPRRE